tara:strand:+ start:605 stop:814 length:210 start_codon:yes stop_codon:yes gene_type:complete
MKIYIVHYESLETGYNIEGFANLKHAKTLVSKLNRRNRKKEISMTKEPKIIHKEIPISKKGLLTAINYI